VDTKFDLSGKVAIVTGGGRGIGRAIALGLAGAGAKVVVGSRTQKEIEEVAAEISRLGGKALPVAVDLTVNEQLENLVNTTVRELGRIDILVNNAARSFLRSLMDLREDGWDKVFTTNVKAVWLLSRLVALTVSLGMTPVVEIHKAPDVKRALRAGGDVILINNRDLNTLKLNSQTVDRLAKNVPRDNLVIAGSGYATPEDIADIESDRVRSVLVGKALLADSQPEQLLRHMVQRAERL